MFFLVAVVLALPLHAASVFGGDSSAGGGGGGGEILSISNWNGTLKVSVTSKPDGLAGTILKYFKLAGAREEKSRNGCMWLLEGKSSGMVFEEESDEGTGETHLRSAFDLEPSQVLDVRYGRGHIFLEFEGSLAARLFETMAASGLEPSSYSPNEDPNSDDLGTPRSFRDGDLYCDRIGRVAGRLSEGPTCSLSAKN